MQYIAEKTCCFHKITIFGLITIFVSACGGGGGGNNSGGGGGSGASVIPQFAYVVNRDDNNISGYDVDSSTGALTALSDVDDASIGDQSTIAAGTEPLRFAVDPSSKFLYVANVFSNDVSAYIINSNTGALTPIDADGGTGGIQSYPVGTDPRSVTIDPSGKFIYVTNTGSNDVSGGIIDQNTGELTPIDADAGTGGIQNFSAGTGPRDMTFHPSGEYAYVTNVNSDDISTYSVDQNTGELTAVGGTVATESQPIPMVVDSSGQYAYVANRASSSISAYSINGVTGALTQIDADAGTGGVQSYAAAGLAPVSMAYDSSGDILYVVYRDSNTLSAYSISDVDGTLTTLADVDAASGGNQVTISAGTTPRGVTIDPSGQFIYVVTSGSTNVITYSIDSGTGALTFVGTVSTGNNPFGIVVTE